MSREIKDIKNRITQLLVYPRTHIKAVVVDEDTTLENMLSQYVTKGAELESVIASSSTVGLLQESLENKQDTIEDLAVIRQGAALGMTSIQEHQDISGKADKATTLEGYGITDCYISNGVINIKDETITPVITTPKFSAGLLVANNVDNNSNPIVGDIYIPQATSEQLGVIKVGNNLTVESDGTLNAPAVPTKLSDLEDDVVNGEYLPLSGGTIDGPLRVNGGLLLGNLGVSVSSDSFTVTNLSGNNIFNLLANGTIDLNTINFYEGSNTAYSVASLAISKRLIIVTTSSSESLSLSGTPAPGREIHLIINNNGSADISIALPNTGSYVCLSDTVLTVKLGGYAEVNIISDGTKMYIRSL